MVRLIADAFPPLSSLGSDFLMCRTVGCLESSREEGKLTLLSCGHSFHQECRNSGANAVGTSTKLQKCSVCDLTPEKGFDLTADNVAYIRETLSGKTTLEDFLGAVDGLQNIHDSVKKTLKDAATKLHQNAERELDDELRNSCSALGITGPLAVLAVLFAVGALFVNKFG